MAAHKGFAWRNCDGFEAVQAAEMPKPETESGSSVDSAERPAELRDGVPESQGRAGIL